MIAGLIKTFWHWLRFKNISRPLPRYGYVFLSVDHDNMTECQLIARCSVTMQLYQEAIIVPCNIKILQRNRSRTLIIKSALCEMMNDRLGVKVEAPQL